ncbi:MAG: hypothetical protein R2737_10775 [Candidatus Nanopelagicales bacterium]
MLALLNVAPLLVWVFGLGSFSAWFLFVSLPALVVIAVAAVVAWRTPGYERLRLVISLGALGGLIGTVGYDLFRVPFVMAGRGVLAPIESYGVLLTDATASSDVTAFAGWTYHFLNGICFGIAYAAAMLGRSLWWAVLWAMVLESATIVTPFATYYALTGKYDVIAIAYAAHIPYGLALGWMTRRPREMKAKLDEISPWTVPAAFGLLLVVLLVWLRPFSTGTQVATFDVGTGKLQPTWVRVPTGTCVPVSNSSDAPIQLEGIPDAPEVPAGGEATVCITDPGVRRIGVAGTGRSSGYVISDPEMPGAVTSGG